MIIVEKFKIVEIGARDGRLSYFLRKKFEERGETNIEIHATDTCTFLLSLLVILTHNNYFLAHVLNSWDNEPPAPVVPAFNTLDAIAKYQKNIKLCALIHFLLLFVDMIPKWYCVYGCHQTKILLAILENTKLFKSKVLSII